MTVQLYAPSVQRQYDISICLDAQRNPIAQLHKEAADVAKTKMH